MSFPSALARGFAGEPVPQDAAAPAPRPDLAGAARHPSLPELTVRPARGRRALVWLFVAVGVVLVVLVAYFLRALGPAASIIGMVVALVPLSVVLVAVHVIDRWEPEPRSLVVLAVAWGGIVAIGIALGVDYAMILLFGQGGSESREVFQAVVQAPLVEETAKGLGVFLIFVVARRAFDGPVDGIVYGALVAAGFAFTENVQYFALSLLDGGTTELTTTFFLRGILSPFAHVMFTSVTGFAVGLAARRGARAGAAFGRWVVGVLGAACLHALWNGSAQIGRFLPLYLLLQVPLFVLFIVGVVMLRREEQRLTRLRLGEYARAGWFTPREIEMLATTHGRRTALQWARMLRGDRSGLMKAFIVDATALAAVRQRIVTGRDRDALADQQRLLTRTVAVRRALLAP